MILKKLWQAEATLVYPMDMIMSQFTKIRTIEILTEKKHHVPKRFWSACRAHADRLDQATLIFFTWDLIKKWMSLSKGLIFFVSKNDSNVHDLGDLNFGSFKELHLSQTNFRRLRV